MTKEELETKYGCLITKGTGHYNDVTYYIASEYPSTNQIFNYAVGTSLIELEEDIKDEIELRGRG